jgi:hypothetical protein
VRFLVVELDGGFARFELIHQETFFSLRFHR